MSRGRKGEQTEAALKDAARRVLERKGYFNTTITDITAEAGRSHGSFHHYFASKDELLIALTAEHAVNLCGQIDPEEHAQGLHTWVGMRAHVREFWRAFRDHQAVSVAIFQAAMISDDFARRWRDVNAHNIEVLADHLRVSQAAGHLPHLDPRLAAAALAAMWSQFCLLWNNPALRPVGVSQDPELAIDTLARLALSGISGQQPSAEP
ncbi:hypothetical protein CcI49_14380 [Frankia sp. CcI49]|uniref:TetR/AcrR family transcriptional regulator n=1 Tax=Frankia sp. CcI49 TaxID=1745382 RepID=UPI000977E03D|nr:TetR/AcrR family transcriptional regulator [Frankia sp. CcI49]ONH59903.1 hypothetical protein CcI49_14380 [Frankia sp. CcI49]